jgi:hypothetical protein
MRQALARGAIGLAAIAAVVMLALAPFLPAGAELGLTFAAHGPDGGLPPAVVAPGSIAAKAGIRGGELLRLEPDTDDERIRLSTLHTGESVTLVDRESGRRFVLVDRAAHPRQFLAVAAQAAIFIAYAAIALVLIRRAKSDRRALDLAAFLAAFGFGGGLAASVLPNARSFWWVLAAIVTQSAPLLGGAFATIFSASFPRPRERGFGSVVRRLVPWVTVSAIVATMVEFATPYFLPNKSFGWFLQVMTCCWAFYVLGSVGALMLTLRSSAGLERQQLLWITTTFAAGFSGVLVFLAAVQLGGDVASFQYAQLSVGLIPFGLAYVILRHRVVDVGFALNRAAVFGAVSLVVVGTFVALEWFISKYLLSVGHVASSAVELAVALAIGFSLRPVHARIDRIVDDLFFRKRHEAEQRLRRFARELPFFTDRDTALQRTCEIVTACADATLVAVYERAPGGFRNVSSAGIPFLSENDPAVVAFKAWREPVALDESGSELGDGLAFGLQVREETIGFFALGPKKGGEAYAPDERDALESVARALASLLDALEIAELRRRLGFAARPASV